MNLREISGNFSLHLVVSKFEAFNNPYRIIKEVLSVILDYVRDRVVTNVHITELERVMFAILNFVLFATRVGESEEPWRFPSTSFELFDSLVIESADLSKDSITAKRFAIRVPDSTEISILDLSGISIAGVQLFRFCDCKNFYCGQL